MVDNRKIDFRVDTSADMTVIPSSLCNAHKIKRLEASDKKLYIPRRNISTQGKSTATIKWNNASGRQ